MDAGVIAFVVVTGHRGEEVAAFAKSLSVRLGVPVETVENAEWGRGNGMSLLAGRESLQTDRPFLVMMADHVVDPMLVRKVGEVRQSAALLDVLLNACGVSGEIRREVKRLVALHEVGGDPRSDLLQDADSLSFFEVNLPLFAAREGTEVTRKRCLWGFQRLSALGRARLTDITHHKPELRRLLTDLVGRADDSRSEILSAGSE
jgi:hypothetical protein